MTLEQLAAHFEASAERWSGYAVGGGLGVALARAETFAYCARELRRVIGENATPESPSPAKQLPSWLREVEPDRWSISDRD